jgi:hypothetical protein
MKRSDVVEFLRASLAGGAVRTAELEEKARAAGLLADHMRIGDSKIFKAVKQGIGITSRRDGFGAGGGWHWQLPTQNRAETPLAEAVEVIHQGIHSRPNQKAVAEPLRSDPQSVSTVGMHPIPRDWVRGVALLECRIGLAGIRPLRWKLFVGDCAQFLASHWAVRACELGWAAESLFGYLFEPPTEHLGTAGLVWNLAGGELRELFRDGAVIVAANGKQQPFKKRSFQTGASLPWNVARSKREGTG